MQAGQFQGYVEQRRRGEISTPPQRRASKEVLASPRRQPVVAGVAEATRNAIGLDAFRSLYFSTTTHEREKSVQQSLTPSDDPGYIKSFYPVVSEWSSTFAKGAPSESTNSAAFNRKIGMPATLQSPENVGSQMGLGVQPPGAATRSVYKDSFTEFRNALGARRTKVDPDSHMGKLGCMEQPMQSINSIEFDAKPRYEMKPNPPFRPFENINTVNQKRRLRTDRDDPIKFVRSTYESAYHHPPIPPIDWAEIYGAKANGGVLLTRENTEAFRASSSEKDKRSRWGGPL
jgi:hypothetical protein